MRSKGKEKGGFTMHVPKLHSGQIEGKFAAF
jgi:hypothetical protein